MPEPPVQVNQVNIVVPEVSAAVEFFQAFGLAVPTTLDTWMPHHRTIASTLDGFDADVDSTVFARQWDRALPEGWTGVVLGVRVPTRDDVDQLYARVTAAGFIGQPPYDAFWGARYAVVHGPGDLVVGIMSPRDDEHMSAPPDPATFETS